MAQGTERFGQLRLRQSQPDDLLDTTPLPIYHHPVVSISAILIVASFAQICVWLIRIRLVNSPPVTSSAATVHGWLHEALLDGLARMVSGSAYPTAVFLFFLGVGLLSSLVWYVAVRLAFGPAWGLAAAIGWAAHPGFAFLVQKPASLILTLLVVPTVLVMLFWWKTSKHRLWLAPLIGVALGGASLVATVGICCVPLVLLAICLVGKAVRYRFISTVLCVAAYASIVVPWWTQYLTEAERDQLQSKMHYDFWIALSSGEQSAMANAAESWLATHSDQQLPSAWHFLFEYGRSSPTEVLRWVGLRGLKAVYTTADGRFQRPLLVLQMIWLIPAMWGCAIAVRYGPWRWAALTGLSVVLVAWFIAALTEPLTRNLAPVGGLVATFALIGVADVYERMFGRRLAKNPESRPQFDVQ